VRSKSDKRRILEKRNNDLDDQLTQQGLKPTKTKVVYITKKGGK